MRRSILLAAFLFVPVAFSSVARASSTPAPSEAIDDFESLAPWSAYAADGVDVDIRPDSGRSGNALRVDFDFRRGSGYAVVRRSLAVDLPENYAFCFSIRGEAPANHLEFKLIDSSGENVWWSVRRDFDFPRSWETVRVKKRQVGFAWGPLGGGELDHVAAVEIAIMAGSGGRGSVWIDDLALQTLPPAGEKAPEIVASASSSLPGSDPSLVLDGDSSTAWRSAAEDARSWLALDLGGPREYGGIVVEWETGLHASDYNVEVSDDGAAWRSVREVRGGNGGRDPLALPETESAFLRLVAGSRTNVRGVAIRGISLMPLEWTSSREAYFQALAREAPRGTYPRGMSGEASYWTVVGVDGDTRECLLGEDGALEISRGGCSVEPFLYADGRLSGWADVGTEQTLLEGRLPIPTVTWRARDLTLDVTAWGTGQPESSSVAVRYRVSNRGGSRKEVTLFLAIRPFQVNPPYQFLNLPGGTARIGEIGAGGGTVRVNGGEPGEQRIVSLTPGPRFGAATFDEGDIVADFLRGGRLPARGRAWDPFEAASGALAYDLDLAPGDSDFVFLLVPLHEGSPIPRIGEGRTAEWFLPSLGTSLMEWADKLARVGIRLPAQASEMSRTVESQLAYILINRAGPAIQPGTRSYARSWIRDGSLTSSALLRLGHPEPVRAFIEWFAPNQYENGKIPCVVDARGPDPVPELDSGGEFIFLIAEYYRYTADRELLERMWPRVRAAAAHLDSLRQTRRTEEYRSPEKARYFGLLPPSISHEGYSAKPMHSYWDDFWALRGFKDAAWLAGTLGDERERVRWSGIRDEFQRELLASIDASMKDHGIDYIPGCADLGDFDATSTTVALSPAGAEGVLPSGALRRTFEKYWEFTLDRSAGGEWEAYTPYEARNIGAFVRLGWRDRAEALAGFLLADRRPAGWNQWAEVVWRDARAPRFIGDMPHTWVGSDFIRSVLDMFLYVREEDEALVLGAGIPLEWARDSRGVIADDLRTPYGPVSFTMSPRGDGLSVRIEGECRVPCGGIVVRPPFDGEPRRVTIDGKETSIGPGPEVVVRSLPATVVFLH